ncbi:PREDICTED: uncharacterized protein LOC104772369 [Camelina sativa]|uniref:Uncharacterized protein LOC104772369 n=1 Tax=Camelina sativa TaxID=90675 RepID=A0ABM0Y4F4_CAMSA|nr:PREDICTED: uncharacterized protein LOC104772369 [Camelina sativa]
MDEAESSFMNAQARVYPPQPEVEFGFPKVCYCGGQPLLSTSYNRRFFTCGSIDDGEMHIHKWWDEAVMEEMREMGRQCEVLSLKVDNLALSSDYGSHMSDETEQKISRIEKEVFELGKIRNRFIIGFELIALVAIVDSNLIQEPIEPKKQIFIPRNREEGHNNIWNDYFSDTPTYPEYLFRRRFRMHRPLFMRIVQRLSTKVEYFRQSQDATGRASLSPIQKCTAAIRQLAYGTSSDTVDEYVRIGGSTARKCLHEFTAAIIQLFGDEYLRPWKGMYSRSTGEPTIVLEAVASYDLWIWYAFFGAPGTMNDLNILDGSNVFDDILNGKAPEVNYFVNGREYNLAYYLTDGIYPKWALLYNLSGYHKV